MKTKVAPGSNIDGNINPEDREKEEFICENINDCEELANELDQLMVGRLFYDQGRL